MVTNPPNCWVHCRSLPFLAIPRHSNRKLVILSIPRRFSPVVAGCRHSTQSKSPILGMHCCSFVYVEEFFLYPIVKFTNVDSKFSTLYCTALYTLQTGVLHCIALLCSVYCTALYTLQTVVLHCIALLCSVYWCWCVVPHSST